MHRHETLRTVFVSGEGDPQQEIAADGGFALQLFDLRNLSGSESSEQVRTMFELMRELFPASARRA